MKRAIKICLVLLAVLLSFLLAVLLYYAHVTRGLKLEKEKLTLNVSCVQLYDGADERIETSVCRAATPYSAFPKALPEAFIAVEDKNFFKHNGFDYKRIAKAAVKNAVSFSFREGASTISQQLVKNTHLSGEKTITRKLKEFKLTRALERRYSKEEIMELYLNSIYFGHSAFGVGEAARFYFGKQVEELSAAECATLAALVKSPNRYSPFRDGEKCLARRNLVLRFMREQGYLSEEEYAEAAVEALPASPTRGEENAYLARVYEEFSELCSDVRSDEAQQLKIYTFYDPALQAQLEAEHTECDRCVVVRDVKTDGIKALSSTCGVINRLPASTIKPLLVYAPALEENLVCPLTPVLDERTNFSGYSPDDYEGASGKYMSVREALAGSVNIPAVKIFNELGIERGTEYLGKMNLRVEREDYSLALALGGMREGFTLPALADGYATFAKGGNFSASKTIRRIEDRSGKILYRFDPQPRAVFSEEVSYLMSDMLRSAAEKGTARALKPLPFPVYAKTGTGGTEAGNTDAYTIAYTSRDVVGVWLGNRDNSPVNATGGGLPANIAGRTLKYLYRENPPEEIKSCVGVTRLEYDREAYESKHRILLADPLSPVYLKGSELFLTRALPTEQSERFTRPSIEKPAISVKNGTVSIQLCQTEYYDYIVKRENRGEITTVYQGKYQRTICDGSVRAGESYRYTVTPCFQNQRGVAVELPLVHIPKEEALPEDWWD